MSCRSTSCTELRPSARSSGPGASARLSWCALTCNPLECHREPFLPRRELLTCARTQGIINATPDSFSDGGDFFDIETAVRHAKELVRKPWSPRPSDALWRLKLHFFFFSFLCFSIQKGGGWCPHTGHWRAVDQPQVHAALGRGGGQAGGAPRASAQERGQLRLDEGFASLTPSFSPAQGTLTLDSSCPCARTSPFRSTPSTPPSPRRPSKWVRSHTHTLFSARNTIN